MNEEAFKSLMDADFGSDSSAEATLEATTEDKGILETVVDKGSEFIDGVKTSISNMSEDFEKSQDTVNEIDLQTVGVDPDWVPTEADIKDVSPAAVLKGVDEFVNQEADEGSEPFQKLRRSEAFINMISAPADRIQKAREMGEYLGIETSGIAGDSRAYSRTLAIYDTAKKLEKVFDGDMVKTQEELWKAYPELEHIVDKDPSAAALALHNLDEVRTTKGVIDAFQNGLNMGADNLRHDMLWKKKYNGYELTENEEQELLDIENRLKEYQKKETNYFDSPVASAIGATAPSLPVIGQSLTEAGIAGVGVGFIAGLAAYRLTGSSTTAMSVARYAFNKAGRAGMFNGMYEPEAGAGYEEFLEMKDNDGNQLLTNHEARRAAMLKAGLVSGIEMIEADMLAGIAKGSISKPVGSLIDKWIKNDITKKVEEKAVTEVLKGEIIKQSTVLAMAKAVAKPTGKSAIVEDVEESLQSASGDIIKNEVIYEHPNAGDKPKTPGEIVSDAIDAGLQALVPGAVFGFFPGTIGGLHAYSHTRTTNRLIDWGQAMDTAYHKNVSETIKGTAMLAQLQATVQNSNLNKIAPKVQKEIIRKQIEQNAPDKAMVHVDVELAMQSDKGKEDLKKLAEAQGMSEEELNKAIEGGTMNVATEVFAQVPTSPEVLNAVTFDQDATPIGRIQEQARQDAEDYKRIMQNGIRSWENLKKNAIAGVTDKDELEAIDMAFALGLNESPKDGLKQYRGTVQGRFDEVIAPAMEALQRGMKQGVDINVDQETGQGTKISNNEQWYRDFYAEHHRAPSKAELQEMAYQMTIGDNAAPQVEGWTARNAADVAGIQQSDEAIEARQLHDKLAAIDRINTKMQSLDKTEVALTQNLSKEAIEAYHVIWEAASKASENNPRLRLAHRMSAIMMARNADIYAQWYNRRHPDEKPLTALDWIKKTNIRMGQEGEAGGYHQDAAVQAEMDAVREKYEGTEQWMKAPNGEPTNLTEKQWLIVRTPSFKRWFGDWEAASHKDYLKNNEPIEIDIEHGLQNIVPDELLNRFLKGKKKAIPEMAKQLRPYVKSEVTGTAIGTINISNNSISDTLYHGGGISKIATLVRIDDLLKQAREVGQREIENNKISHILAVPIIGNGKYSGTRFIAMMVVNEDSHGNKFYDHEFTTIKKLDEISSVGRETRNLAASEKHQALSSIIAEDVWYVNEKDTSKLVDENGEPKVYYHGTDSLFAVFSPQDVVHGREQGDGYYFTDDERIAEGYGKNKIAVFLNVRNPFYRDDVPTVTKHFEENQIDEAEAFYFEKKKDWEKNANGYARFEPTADAIEDNGFDVTYATSYKIEPDESDDALVRGSTVVVYNPNQIKSATDNNGNFSLTDNNIYHQMAGERGAANMGGFMAKRLIKAKQMLAEGKFKEDIWHDTGWTIGKDGKWRFEIPDNLDLINWYALDSGKTTLGKLYPNTMLYVAYPFLKDIPVYSDVENNAEHDGYTDSVSIHMKLDKSKYYTENYGTERGKILVHEIQHVIQAYEGFASGGNPEAIKRILSKAIYNAELEIGGVDSTAYNYYRAVNNNSSQSVIDQYTRKMSEADKAKAMELGGRMDVLRKYLKRIRDAQITKDPYKIERAKFAAYWNLAGEHEARNTANRSLLFTESELIGKQFKEYANVIQTANSVIDEVKARTDINNKTKQLILDYIEASMNHIMDVKETKSGKLWDEIQDKSKDIDEELEIKLGNIEWARMSSEEYIEEFYRDQSIMPEPHWGSVIIAFGGAQYPAGNIEVLNQQQERETFFQYEGVTEYADYVLGDTFQQQQNSTFIESLYDESKTMGEAVKKEMIQHSGTSRDDLMTAVELIDNSVEGIKTGEPPIVNELWGKLQKANPEFEQWLREAMEGIIRNGITADSTRMNVSGEPTSRTETEQPKGPITIAYAKTHPVDNAVIENAYRTANPIANKLKERLKVASEWYDEDEIELAMAAIDTTVGAIRYISLANLISKAMHDLERANKDLFVFVKDNMADVYKQGVIATKEHERLKGAGNTKNNNAPIAPANGNSPTPPIRRNAPVAPARRPAERPAATKGTTEFGQNLSAIVRLFETADESTLIHEFSHIFLRDLEYFATIDPVAAKELETIHKWADWKKGDAYKYYHGTRWYKEFADREQAIIDAENGNGPRDNDDNPITADALKRAWFHERFARGFELYLKEGKAPVPALRKIFEQFKDWMQTLYSAFINEGAMPSRDVRMVMDRMIATEDEIKYAAMDERWADIEEAGGEKLLTESEKETYERWLSEAKAEAEDKLRKIVMRDLNNESQTKFRKRIENERQRYTEELQKQPNYMAYRAYQETGDENIVLNWYGSQEEFVEAMSEMVPLEDAVNQHMKEFEAQADKERIDGHFSDETIQQVMQSDKYMVKRKALEEAALERKERLVNRVNDKAKAAMQGIEEALGNIPEDVEIADARVTDDPQVKALLTRISKLNYAGKWNSQQMNMINAMLKAATKAEVKAKLKEFKDSLKNEKINLEAVEKATEGQIRAMREQARKQVLESPISIACDYTGHMKKAKTAERNCNAMIKGKKYDMAVGFKRQATYSYILAEESKKMQGEVEKLLKKVEKQHKARSVKLPKDERYWHSYLLYCLRIIPEEPQKPEGVAKLEEIYQNLVDSLDIQYVPSDIIEMSRREDWIGYRSLRLDELQDAVDALTVLYTTGKDKFNMKSVKGVTLEEAIDSVLGEHIDKESGEVTYDSQPADDINTDRHTIEDDKGGLGYIRTLAKIPGIGEWAAKQGPRFLSMIIQPSTIFNTLGKGAKTYLQDLYAEAFRKEQKMNIAHIKTMEDLLSAYSKKERRTWKDKKYRFTNLYETQLISKEEMFCMALNMGNRTNIARLVLGLDAGRMNPENGEIDSRLVKDFLNEHMTKKDWELVQSIWKYLDSYWEETCKVEEQLNGVALHKVENGQIRVTAADTGEEIVLDGGYYPIKYNPAKSSKAQDQADVTEAVRRLSGAQVLGAGRGFTKARTDVNVCRPLLLSFDVINDHCMNVIHNICYRIAARDVYRIVKSARVEDYFRESLGADYHRVLQEWAADSWAVINGDTNTAAGAVNQIASFLRRNSVMAIMGYKLWPAIENVSNIALVADQIGTLRAAKAVTDFYANPRDNLQLLRKSIFMSNRLNSMDPDLRRQRELFVPGNAILEQIKGHAYWLMEKSDLMFSAPLWCSVYKNSLAKNIGEVQTEQRELQLKLDTLQKEYDEINAQIIDSRRTVGQITEEQQARYGGFAAAEENPFRVKRDIELHSSKVEAQENIKNLQEKLWKKETELELARDSTILEGDDIFKEAERRTIIEADQAVKDCFGSSAAQDMSSVQRSKNEYVKLFTTFYSFFNTQFNALLKNYIKGGYGMRADQAAEQIDISKWSTYGKWAPFARAILFRIVITAAIGSVLKFALGLEGSSDDDKWKKKKGADGKEHWTEVPWSTRLAGLFAKNIVGTTFGALPFIRDIANYAVAQAFDGNTYGRGINVGSTVIKGVSKLQSTVEMIAKQSEHNLKIEEAKEKREQRLKTMSKKARAKYEADEKYRKPQKPITNTDIAKSAVNAVTTLSASYTGITNTVGDSIFTVMQYMNDTDNIYDKQWQNVIWSVLFDKKPVEREIPKKPETEPKKKKNRK